MSICNACEKSLAINCLCSQVQVVATIKGTNKEVVAYQRGNNVFFKTLSFRDMHTPPDIKEVTGCPVSMTDNKSLKIKIDGEFGIKTELVESREQLAAASHIYTCENWFTAFHKMPEYDLAYLEGRVTVISQRNKICR